LVASDLDGTLVRSDGTVSPRTRRALADAERAGITVVFVSGRPLRWARDVFEHVVGHGLAIISNGALVWDVAGDRAALERPIPAEVGLEVARVLREAVPGTTYAVETTSGIVLEHVFQERYRVPEGARRTEVEGLFEGPVLKLLARHEELDPQDFWDRAERAVGHLVEITWSSSTALLEMSAAGVTKATTLERRCEDLGIDRAEVVALGDMPNDLAMLGWAGTSYAMANAHDSVRKVADHVAASNDDDGVAQVIESLLR
jgi:Cof subfamily protein (haloacid dehalogenase superfamily)